MQSMPVLAALDADGDGTISAQEIDNASARLRSLDKDGDGSLSVRELMPQGRGMGAAGQQRGPGQQREGMPGAGRRSEGGPGAGPEMISKMFDARDKDGDGKLTGDEIPERMQDRLDKIDGDQDGSVSRQEMESAMSKMRGRGGKQGGGKDAGRPGGDRPRRPDAT
jgi:Ca2+-binding EF-hand superfamily protein